ncbi:hypothetical protein AB0C10_21350 [Microbispora amethystogenes]|uniref:hypothetical protein n=1 Tax=Microbispora amethystogenes TaxID=1427754 RepID=UPI0033EFBB42
MLKKNSLSGGTNGATITTANSGGVSGSAFDEIFGSPKYTTTNAIGGRAPMVAQFAYGDSLGWTFTLGARTFWTRAYIYITGSPDSSYNIMRDAADGIRLTLSTSRILTLTNGGFTPTTFLTATTAIPTNQWVRIEVKVTYGTTTSNGSCELRIYTSADSSTAADTKTASGVNTGTTPATGLQWAYISGASHYIDDLAVTDVDWIGPASISQEVTPGVVSMVITLPAPAIGTGLTVKPGPVLAPWSVPEPEVFVGSLTVPANPDVISVPWTIPAPDVQAFKNVEIEPEPIMMAMAIPSPVVGVPPNPGDQITKAGQIEWNGFLIGADTPYRMQTLDGWITDLPDLDSGNVPQPNRHGSYSGRDLAQERHVILGGQIRAPREEMEQAYLDLIAAMTVLEDDTELPLAIRLMGITFVGYGKAAQRRVPVDKNFRLGLAQMTLQWTLSDPVLLSRELHSAVITDGTTQQLANLGNTRTFPLVRVPGPAEDPLIAVQHPIAGERVLEFGITIPDGQTLIVDPYYGNVTMDGADRLGTLTGSSVPPTDLVLPAGLSDVTYGSGSGGAPPITVLWRHAYM